MAKPIEITVCMGSACFARGNDLNIAFIEKYLIENDLEANIELIGSRCEGECADGPNMFINGVSYNKVDEKLLKEILDSYI